MAGAPAPRAGDVGAGRSVGRLVSVDVGLPKDVSWQGKTVFTSVFKDPVDGPRRVRRLNVDGDGQGDLAGHGGEQRAVFVYQLGSYRYWERELERDDFVYGQFGENFTVEELGDDEVRREPSGRGAPIGQRLRSGAGRTAVASFSREGRPAGSTRVAGRAARALPAIRLAQQQPPAPPQHSQSQHPALFIAPPFIDGCR